MRGDRLVVAKYHILFGFDDPDIVQSIISMVKKPNNVVEYACCTTKSEIQEYWYYHPDITTFVLREVMGNESFSAEELAAFNDAKTFNIIVVLEEFHKGKEYMQILYAAGITSAILLEANNGASPAEISELILMPRSRRRAREVYGMSQVKGNLNILTSDIFLSKYTFLMDETQGVNIIDRYLMIIKSLTIKQGVEFTKKLPANVRKELMEYEEYYKVQDFFIMNGIAISYKKPKNLKKGLSDSAFQIYLESKVKNTNRRKKRGTVQSSRVVQTVPSSNKPNIPVKRVAKEEVPVQEETFDITKNIFADDSNWEAAQQEHPATERVDIQSDEDNQNNDVQSTTSLSSAPMRTSTNSNQTTVIKKPKKKNRNNDDKQKEKKNKGKINWKLLSALFSIGIMLLILWFIFLKLQSF